MKVPPGWDLPLSIRTQLAGDRFGRQREILDDEHLVLVLHRAPQGRVRNREGVYFWRSPQGDWKSTDRRKPMVVLTEMIAEYEEAILRSEEAHETAQTAAQKFAVLENVGPLNRALRNFADTLTRARESLSDSNARQELQPLIDHTSDIARSGELLQVDARNSLDFHIARQSEIQAEHSRQVEKATHRLNTMATIFLPLTAVASVFGMNLRSGLEDAPPSIFWGIMIGSIVAGLVVSEVFAAIRTRRLNIKPRSSKTRQ